MNVKKRLLSLSFAGICLSQILYTPPVAAFVGLCCTKCGGNMPMNIPGGGVPETHEFRFKISPMFMRMEDLRDGTNDVGTSSILGIPAPGVFMAAPTSMDMTMLNFTAGYSFTDDFFAGLMMMWKKNEMDMRFNSAMQTLTGQSGFTMRSEGMGDTMLMTKYRLFADDPLIPTRQGSLFLGLSLPTGSINEKNKSHPLPIRQQEQLPYGMQLGSGTFDPTIGFLYQGSSSPNWWGINAMYTPRLYENSRDYRLGDEFRLDLYDMYQFRYNLVSQVQLNISHQGKIRGEMDAAVSGASGHAAQGNAGSPYMTPLWDPDNYGGDKILATVGLQWQPASMHILDVNLGIPLYQDLNGPQLKEDYRLMFTWYMEIPTKASIRYQGKTSRESQLGF